MTVTELYCGYGGEDIVKGVSFTLPPNKSLVIAGPNGCGKTTLLRAIGGNLPYRGSIRIGDKEVSEIKPRRLAESMAVLTQLSSVYFPYTVYETVLTGRYAKSRGLLSSYTKEDREKAEAAIEEMGLSDCRDRRITELSGGQLQRTFLARTFAQEPEIIILDEPTNHIDLKHAAALTEKLKEWVNVGNRRVIGVFHDINLAMSFADIVLLMKDGQQVKFGGAEEVFLSPDIDKVYDTDVRGFMLRSLEKWQRYSL